MKIYNIALKRFGRLRFTWLWSTTTQIWTYILFFFRYLWHFPNAYLFSLCWSHRKYRIQFIKPCTYIQIMCSYRETSSLPSFKTLCAFFVCSNWKFSQNWITFHRWLSLLYCCSGNCLLCKAVSGIRRKFTLILFLMYFAFTFCPRDISIEESVIASKRTKNSSEFAPYW
jgi:hypothetical protein